MKVLQRLTTKEEELLIGRLVVTVQENYPNLYCIILGIKRYENKYIVLDCYDFNDKKILLQDWKHEELIEILNKKILKPKGRTEYLI